MRMGRSPLPYGFHSLLPGILGCLDLCLQAGILIKQGRICSPFGRGKLSFDLGLLRLETIDLCLTAFCLFFRLTASLGLFLTGLIRGFAVRRLV